MDAQVFYKLAEISAAPDFATSQRQYTGAEKMKNTSGMHSCAHCVYLRSINQ